MQFFYKSLLFGCVLHVSLALDLCKPMYPAASCYNSCPTNYQLRETTFSLCSGGQSCCESPDGTTEPIEGPDPGDPLVVGPDTCGVQGSRSKRSIGGSVTSTCAWPWLVSVRFENTGIFARSHVLTGILVSKTQVLVHKATFDAYYNIPDQVWTVDAATGEYYLNMEGDEEAVHSINVNDKVEIGNDYLLFRLGGEAVNVESCVRPVCLSNEEESASLNMTECKLIGWGQTETGTGLTWNPIPTVNSVAIESGDLCGRIMELMLEPDDPILQETNILCLDMNGQVATPGDLGNAIVCPDNRGQWHLKGMLTRDNYEQSDVAFAFDISKSADNIREKMN